MKEIDQLKPATRKMLPGWVKEDLTTDWGRHLLFLTHVFKDGEVMGFWSHSPWGRETDQEQGWVIIDKDGTLIDQCATRTNGEPAGEGFRDWLKFTIKHYGKRTKLCPEWENKLIWKISEC